MAFAFLKTSAGSPRVGVGETGLDYTTTTRRGPRSGRPLRGPSGSRGRSGCPSSSTSARRTTMGRHPPHRGAREGVIHCFTGNRDDARRYLDLGFHISFAGIVTFKNADSLREAVRAVPLDRLLVERLADLAPIPHRGRRNEPDTFAWSRRRRTTLNQPFATIAERRPPTRAVVRLEVRRQRLRRRRHGQLPTWRAARWYAEALVERRVRAVLEVEHAHLRKRRPHPRRQQTEPFRLRDDLREQHLPEACMKGVSIAHLVHTSTSSRALPHLVHSSRSRIRCALRDEVLALAAPPRSCRGRSPRAPDAEGHGRASSRMT